MMQKKALITGITGQDGSYLSELLIEKGYEVHGIVRRNSRFNRERIDGFFTSNMLHNNPDRLPIKLHYGDLSDSSSLRSIVAKVMPDEVYHLAAQSHVKISFEIPEYTADVTGVGTIRMLDTLRDIKPDAKFYQAGSSEMFGLVQEVPQTEKTPFYPRSPYAAAKVFSHWVSTNYREAYNMFVSNGILFNHESPRRGENFVTRKITLGVAAIKLGLQDKIKLGNLEAKRDWGYAKDYVEAMWKILQVDEPDDFVIATGETHTVRDFCAIAFSRCGMNYEEFVEVDEKYFRPTEVDLLIGDPSKAKERLDWKPSISFEELVHLMVDEDLKLLESHVRS